MLKITAIVGVALIVYGFYRWAVKNRKEEGTAEVVFGVLELIFEVIAAFI
jgi:hypothetical protein